MKQIIIGLAGLAGAGKDTFALAAQREFIRQGLSCVLLGFADPLRKIAKAVRLDPFDRDKKEKEVWINADHFYEDLFDGIEEALADVLKEEQRAGLYAAMSEAMADYYNYGVDGRTGYIVISPRRFMQHLGTAGQRVKRTIWVDVFNARRRLLKADVVIVPDFRFEHEADSLNYCVVVTRPGVKPVSAHVSEDFAAVLSSHVVPDSMRHVAITHALNDRTRDDLEANAEQYAQLIAAGRLLPRR
ncbi:hypothetical protein HOR55_gp24 [Ralstonia phage RS-PII-1]|uniref:DNMP kinase n=1 Tax=Ralstonia phage RS-PII-1 TaxID=1932892 RepID=A0A1L7DQB8_9CAUD|nr:hypothetical protein HOR55_gp24 [Ralstonia phage RS-PII-1]APU00311.1 hypothetical protein [Ralstonia phage RS-PII-1]